MSHGQAIPIALLASLAAAGLVSVGMVLQALESRQVEGRHGLRLSLLGRLVRRPRWLAGTVIGYAAFPFQVAALAFAPLVLVQPVQACGLLLVLGLGTRVMRERVGALERLGVAAVVAGIGLVAWGAPPGGDPANSQAALAGCAVALVLLSLVPFALRERCGRLTLMLCAGLGFAAVNMAVKGFTIELTDRGYAVAIAYLALAAIGSLAATVSQMTAFQRHRAVEVVPITFVVPIFVPILMANFVLHERWASAAFAGAPFAVGGLMLLLGTSAVARAKPVVEIARRAAA